MKELLFHMHNTKMIAIQYGINNFDKQKIKEYDVILEACDFNRVRFTIRK